MAAFVPVAVTPSVTRATAASVSASRAYGTWAPAPVVAARVAPAAPTMTFEAGVFEHTNPYAAELKETANYIARNGRGILASDESNSTTGKRLAMVNLENTETNRRRWRELLYTAPDLGQYISGCIMYVGNRCCVYRVAPSGGRRGEVLATRCPHVFWLASSSSRWKLDVCARILTMFAAVAWTMSFCLFAAHRFEETLFQSTGDGKQFVDVLNEQGIKPGIKVDTGLTALPRTKNETATTGLDGLPERCARYYAQGARFAKWRAVMRIGKEDGAPSDAAIIENTHALARYAQISQAAGLVPIVEPEILMDGDHDIETTAYYTERVLSYTFRALNEFNVCLDAALLKPNMVCFIVFLCMLPLCLRRATLGPCDYRVGLCALFCY